MSEDFLSKADFCKRYGVSPRTVDAWVKKGRVERVQDLDLKAYFRMLPEGSVAAPAQPPAWVADLVAQQARIEAKLDALLAQQPGSAPAALLAESETAASTDAPQPAQPGSDPAAPPQRGRWWRRLLYGPEGSP